MNKYKIVFVDIDDTLNPTNKNVSETTKKVMKKIIDQNIKVVVNTGRSNSYAILKSKEAGLSEYVISSNGSEVYNYKTNEVIFQRIIPENTVKDVYNYCNNLGLTLILNSLDKRFVNTEDYNYNDEPVIYIQNIDEVLKNNKISQMIIISKNYDRMLVLPNLFKEKFPNLKTVHSSIALVEQKPEKNKQYYHDLVLENTANSTGIVELLDYLTIQEDEAIAIGNGYDDICMCDVVETSVAVENANEILKQRATLITESAENDGVAKILEKLILKEN